MENTTPQSLITYLLNHIKIRILTVNQKLQLKSFKWGTHSHEEIFSFQLLASIILPQGEITISTKRTESYKVCSLHSSIQFLQ
jgi:hypothetical protein